MGGPQLALARSLIQFAATLKRIAGIFGKSILYALGSATLLSFLFFGLLNSRDQAVYELAGQQTDSATIAALKTELRMDLPLWKQVAWYMNELSPLGLKCGTDRACAWGLKWPSFGKSYQTGRQVGDIVASAFPATLILALASMLMAGIFGISLGFVAAKNENRWWEKGLLGLSTAGMALPSFFSAILVAWLFGYVLREFTGLPPWGSLYSIDNLTGERHLALPHLILPALTLGIRPLSVMLQMTKNTLLSNRSVLFIRTAEAKGLTQGRVWFVHLLRASLGPVWTSFTGWFGSLLAGAVFVEYIFGWKGIGRELVVGIQTMDYPVVMGCIVTTSALFALLNGLTDLGHEWLDPQRRM
jgi:peptide/nickel transport system permease protein